MKIILAIFCALMVLFAGGCALILIAKGSYGPGSFSVAVSVVPGSIAALNVLMLMGMFGSKAPQRWAFYVLTGVDVLAAIAMLALAFLASELIGDFPVLAVPVIALLLLKAWLTVRMVGKLPPHAEG